MAQVHQIDFSALDTIVGSIAGLIVCLVVFFIVGGILLKYKIVKFGNGGGQAVTGLPSSCPVTGLFMAEHYGFIKDIGFLAMECKNIWLEIKDVNKRQITLRESLPKDYVSRDDLTEIKLRLKSIDDKLENYRFIKGTS
jgi:hypothetical protein